MLRVALQECLRGLIDGLGFWKSFSSSRTLSLYALKALPLYLSSVAIGAYLSTLALAVPDRALELWVVWLTLWGLPAYVVGSLLQIRFAWLVTSLIAAATPNVHVQKKDVRIIISEVLYGVLLGVTYLAQTHIFSYLALALLPRALSSFSASAISVVTIAWATTFTAFESKLILKQHDLNRRIAFVETRWSYAIGYGLPASLVYNFAPPLFATPLWQYLQLLLMLRALNLSLPKVCTQRLRFFRVAQNLATFVIALLPPK